MQEYQVIYDPKNKSYAIQGDFAPGSVFVDLPDDNSRKKWFISLFLHKHDIERGIDYQRCISLNNHMFANEALFIAGLSMLAKCFSTSDSRTSLSPKSFLRFAPEQKEALDTYRNWRNKHFMHDENQMTAATAFLIIAPESSESTWGGAPSVVWNTVQVNYVFHSRRLEELLQSLWSYVVQQIDECGSSIQDMYSGYSRDQLLQFGSPHIESATLENPDQKR